MMLQPAQSDAPVSGEERVAMITGATDGIGKATAKLLVSEGWRVVLVGRDSARCAATVKELNGEEDGRASAISADLASMADTRRACEEFLEQHRRLDFLFLNANAIAHERVLTSEHFEQNFALGYLSRALTSKALESVLAATVDSQVLTVVGLNKSRLDFDDLAMERGFKAMEALGRWQWATHLFAREYSQRTSVPMNIYMPGIVKTKILSSEPQPMRTVIRLLYLFFAISVERSAKNVVSVMRDVRERHRRGAYYSGDKLKPNADLKTQAGDGDALWNLTATLLERSL